MIMMRYAEIVMDVSCKTLVISHSGQAAEGAVLISKINTSAWKGKGTADCWCIKKTSGRKMSVFVSWNIATAIAQFDFNYFHFFSFYDKRIFYDR